ncbi:MAG: hypothetical protein ABSC19_01745 [Syntrophorhabdales bacterium]
MKTLLILPLLILLVACALPQKRGENLPWPSGVTSLKGEGDLDMTWGKKHFSGPFVAQVEYPNRLLVEVYGPFGQTLVYVKKEAGRFVLIAGDERTTDETLFEQKYGFRVEQFMDDLLVRGQRQETPEGFVTEHASYLVRYGHDRQGRRKICWQGRNGSICLAFDEMNFVGQ